MKHLAAFVLFLATAPVRADGIPVDRATHRVTVPHDLITLSDSQAEEVESLGTLTLDQDQWRRLRAVSPSYPQRIETLVAASYSDCTCDMGSYGIALSRTRVAVPRGQFDGPAAGRLLEPGHDETVLGLRMDRRGQFYHQGVLVPFPELLTALRARTPSPGDTTERWLVVELPVGVTPQDATVATRLARVTAAARAAGWSVPGGSTEP